MAIELRRIYKKQNSLSSGVRDVQAQLPELTPLAIQLNNFLARVDEIRGQIQAISWTITDDMFQVMSTVINHPQKLSKADIFKRLGISVHKGLTLIWSVYNALTKLHKEIKDMGSCSQLHHDFDESSMCSCLKKIRQCHFSMLCHLLHENMLEFVKQEQVCREGVLAYFSSSYRKIPLAHTPNHYEKEEVHSQKSLDESNEQEALEEAVVSLLYAVSQVNELMEGKDDLSDHIEYIVATEVEKVQELPQQLPAQPQKITSPRRKRDARCQIM